MTKEKFLQSINYGRYPKYMFSQIKEGEPKKACSALVCTSSDNILLAKFENGRWQQACFTSTQDDYPSQYIYFENIRDKVTYWTDGRPKDKSKRQFEN